MMKTLMAVTLSLGLANAAFAGEPPKQNHHCKMPDGTMDMAKTKKECKAAKGTWAKDAKEPAAEGAAAPAK
jgi:hypothetical protein